MGLAELGQAKLREVAQGKAITWLCTQLLAKHCAAVTADTKYIYLSG
jgi:hypothetical protein